MKKQKQTNGKLKKNPAFILTGKIFEIRFLNKWEMFD